jgi:hypothetical protein
MKFMLKIIFLTSLFSLSDPIFAYALTSNWNDYSSYGERLAYGINISVKVPPDFNVVEETLPIMLKEFNRLNKMNGKITSVSYLNVVMLPPGPHSLSDMFKTTNGEWIYSLINKLLIDIAKKTIGVTNYNLINFKDHPAIDISAKPYQLTPVIRYQEVNIRLIVTDKLIIRLECGDVATDKKLIMHDKNINSICYPYFNSLAFN